jgi:hypothetical protein
MGRAQRSGAVSGSNHAGVILIDETRFPADPKYISWCRSFIVLEYYMETSNPGISRVLVEAGSVSSIFPRVRGIFARRVRYDT